MRVDLQGSVVEVCRHGAAGVCGECREVLGFFTRWVRKLLSLFPYAQTYQAFAHRLTAVVRG